MIVLIRREAPETDVREAVERASRLSDGPVLVSSASGTGVLRLECSKGAAVEVEHSLRMLPAVERIITRPLPYALASREVSPADTVVGVAGVEIGGHRVVMAAGPCAVESRDQLRTVAEAVREGGARLLRGGAFKPRTSPYSFQGLGEEGLHLLREVGNEFGLAVVTEVMAPEQVPMVATYADMLQVGSRNVQNFPLLEAVGRARRPVLLKRGMMSELDELLAAAEYILLGGNSEVVLCERGIRTFEPRTRNTLDVVAVPLLKQLTHLPVLVDPSHATGRAELVCPASRAAVAAGADGLLVEVHAEPGEALSDGHQALRPSEFQALTGELDAIARVLGRRL